MKNIYKVLLVLFLLLLTTGSQRVDAGKKSLVPQAPFLLKAFERKVNVLKSSHTLLFFDDLLQASGLLERFFNLLKFAPAVIEPRQTGPDNGTEGRIKVVTANMLLFPPPFFFNQAERIKEFSKSILDLNPDIILLQEVWDLNSLQVIAQEFPHYWMIFKPAIPINFSGLATLSRLPVVGAYGQKFSPSLRFNFEELLALKGFIVTTVVWKDQQIDVINSHLYSASPRQRFRPNPIQFKRLQQLVLNSDRPVILGGDMNLLPEEINELLLPALIADNCLKPTAGLNRRTKKLDWLFVYAGSEKAASLDSSRLDWPVIFSDHSPVYGEIRFSRPNAR